MRSMGTMLRICGAIGDWLLVGLRLIGQDFGIEDPVWLVILAMCWLRGHPHIR
jgi:hypothetical protein